MEFQENLTEQISEDEYQGYALCWTERFHRCRLIEWEEEFQDRADQEGLIYRKKEEDGDIYIAVYEPIH